ncbi:MAG: MarR family transcriptional regulator [Sedimenticola sp.]|nr:MarR family transcriptional regulator [Sedimenticola sp.]
MNMQQESLGFLLADASRLMRRAFQRQLDGSCLTLAQARALIHVSRHEGVRQIDLAELLEVQPITLARLIDQLAENGLVERRPDPTDRRAYQIFLTSKATPHLAEIKRVAKAIREDVLCDLTASETTRFLMTLSHLRDKLAAY